MTSAGPRAFALETANRMSAVDTVACVAKPPGSRGAPGAASAKHVKLDGPKRRYATTVVWYGSHALVQTRINTCISSRGPGNGKASMAANAARQYPSTSKREVNELAVVMLMSCLKEKIRLSQQ